MLSITRWAVFTMAARTLFWFHPLVWVAERELSVCQESACDVAAMGAAGVGAVEYGRMLLDVVASSLPGRQRVLGVSVVSTYSSLHRRISAMRHFKVWSVRRRVVAGLVIGVVGMGAIVPWKLAAQETKRIGTRSEPPTTKSGYVGIDPATPIVQGEKAVLPGNVLTQQVVIRASRDGTIEKVMAKPGDAVKKGQELARFESFVAQSEVQQAQAALEKDEATLSPMQNAPPGTVSKSGKDSARASLAYDRAQLQLKMHELSALSVRAPIDGIISDVSANDGEFLSKGASVMTVVSMTRPRVGFWIAESVYPKLKVGQPVEFRTRAFEGSFKGKIAFISPVADMQSGTMKVEADVEDPDGSLRPGLAGEVMLSVK